MNQHREWTQEDIDYLNQHYGTEDAGEIAEKMDRTKQAIYVKANRLNLSQEECKWTKAEEDFLGENWSSMSGSEMGEVINRTAQEVLAKGKAIGLPKKGQRKSYNKWTRDEEMFMYQNYTKMKNDDIADELDRTTHSIKRKADRMGLSNRWDQWEDEILFFCYDYNVDSPQELSKTTLSHRTKEAIKLRAQRKLKLTHFKDKVTKVCPNCEKEFKVKYSHRDSRKYCSRSCFISGDEPTDIEKIMKDTLGENNIEHNFQEQIGPYFPDFHIKDTNILIEADGDFWHSDGIKEEREQYLKDKGYEVLHFKGSKIKNDIEGCITEIINYLRGE